MKKNQESTYPVDLWGAAIDLKKKSNQGKLKE